MRQRRHQRLQRLSTGGGRISGTLFLLGMIEKRRYVDTGPNIINRVGPGGNISADITATHRKLVSGPPDCWISLATYRLRAENQNLFSSPGPLHIRGIRHAVWTRMI